MRRPAEEAAKTRQALLDAALSAFEESGWKGATFENVAERAGVTRGALHHHFRNKRVLLSEALDWGWSEYGARLFREDEDFDDAEGYLATLFSRFVTLLQEDARFRSLMSTTVLVAPQAFDRQDRKKDALDDWRQHIAKSLKGARGVSMKIETAAGLVMVLLQGFAVTAVTSPEDLPDPAEELDEAVVALARGLLG